MTASHSQPYFEFVESTQQFPIHKIFLRDTYQLWYHRGLPGISENIRGTAEYLRKEIEKINPKKVVAIGNSMGGYAALLFGYLLNTTLVLAFSPKSFITPWKRFLYVDLWLKAAITRGEFKIIRQSLRLLGEHQADRQYFDLRSALNAPNHVTQYHIFYNCNSRIDRLNATRILDKPGVFPHCFQYRSKHNLVKELRQNGELAHIFTAALVDSNQPVPQSAQGAGVAGSRSAGSPNSI